MRFCAADGRLLFMDVEGWGLEFLPYFKKKKKKNMGAGTSSLERHIEQAKKTGACNLEGMSLTKFPEELVTVASTLRTLNLSNNRLRAIPPDIAHFKNLKSIDLSGNRFSDFPVHLCQCTKLESIIVDRNQLAALPDQLVNLKLLKNLTASENQLQEFNSVLCEMRRLEFVNMASNRIKRLPDDMSNFSAVELNLNGNQLPRLPASVAKAERLKVLRVEENVLSLEGVPVELLASSNVSLLCLDGNVFTNRELSDQPGYEEYMKRYSASRKKAG